MEKAKQRRIETAGWKVGKVDEFLNLTAPEIEYIEMKLTLARKLRQERRGRNLTQIQLANLISSSQSRVAKMEAGDPSVSIDLLVQSLMAIGATYKDIGNAIVQSA